MSDVTGMHAPLSADACGRQGADSQADGSVPRVQRSLKGALEEARAAFAMLRAADSLSGELLLPELRHAEAERRSRVAALLREARSHLQALQQRTSGLDEPIPAQLEVRVQELESRIMEAQWLARQAALRVKRTAAHLSHAHDHGDAMRATMDRLQAVGYRTGLLMTRAALAA